MIDFQRHFVFPAHVVAAAGPLPAGAERMKLETPDGARLAGVHIPPEKAGAEKVLVLGFGGNAWNGQDVATYLHGSSRPRMSSLFLSRLRAVDG